MTIGHPRWVVTADRRNGYDSDHIHALCPDREAAYTYAESLEPDDYEDVCIWELRAVVFVEPKIKEVS